MINVNKMIISNILEYVPAFNDINLPIISAKVVKKKLHKENIIDVTIIWLVMYLMPIPTEKLSRATISDNRMKLKLLYIFISLFSLNEFIILMVININIKINKYFICIFITFIKVFPIILPKSGNIKWKTVTNEIRVNLFVLVSLFILNAKVRLKASKLKVKPIIKAWKYCTYFTYISLLIYTIFIT